MTRRKKLVCSAFAGVGLLIGVVTTNTHWRLYGVCRSEPFCDGLPASYYAARIRTAWVIRLDLGGSVRPRRQSDVEFWFRRHLGDGITAALWPDHIDNNHSPRPFRADTPDAAKLPVLLALVDDNDMRVRWWVSEKLGQVKGEGVPATVAALVRLLQAEEPADRFFGAMALGQRGALDRAALPALFTLRGDKTRVPWFGMTLGDFVDGQIRRIDPTALPKGTDGPTAAETP
jgi:hypothetical protein